MQQTAEFYYTPADVLGSRLAAQAIPNHSGVAPLARYLPSDGACTLEQESVGPQTVWT